MDNWIRQIQFLIIACWLPQCGPTKVWADETDKRASIFDLGQLHFRSVENQDSVSARLVFDIEQDPDGYIWIGSDNGLIRYDGYNFKKYPHEKGNRNSPSSEQISALWISEKGSIWMGTFSDGASFFDPINHRFTHFRQQNRDGTGLSNNYIRKIVGDNTGNVFVGSVQGLDHIDEDTGAITQISQVFGCNEELLRSEIEGLLVDLEGDLWVGSKTGLCKISLLTSPTDNGMFKGQEVTYFSGIGISSLFQSKDGRIWIGSVNDGVFILDPRESGVIQHVQYDTGYAQGLSDSQIEDIAQPTDEEIWVATAGGGLNILDAETAVVKKHVRHDPLITSSINIDLLKSLLVDQSGLVWIGSFGGGLNLHNPGNAGIRTYRQNFNQEASLTDSNISSIREMANGEIWIGNGSSGYDVIDPSVGVIDKFKLQSNTFPHQGRGQMQSLVRFPDESIWLGTSNGLFQVTPDKQQVGYSIKNGLSDNRITRLVIHQEGALWVGTEYGLNLFDTMLGTTKSLAHIENIENVSDKVILSLILDKDQNLWIGTTTGLFLLSIKEQRVWDISNDAGHTETLSDNMISSLSLDSEGRLILTTAMGVDRLENWNGEMAVFESLNAIVDKPGELVANLMEDQNGKIWHYHGWIDPINKTYADLGAAEGWDVGLIWFGSYQRTRDGTLLFGGTDGLLMVRPELWSPWNYHPPLVITDLNVNNQSVLLKEKMKLSPGDTGFSVEFSALDFTAPDQNRYAYKLEGYDRTWIDTDASNRRATYTNLVPGEYRLRIKGTNRNGEWSRYQIDLPITQLPAWYQTFWAKLIAIFAIISFIYLIFVWRFRRYKQQRRELNELVNSRTRDISMLSVIGREITSTLDLEGVLELVYKHVNKLMDANVFTIGILDDRKQCIECKLSIENERRMQPFDFKLSEAARPAVWCVLNNSELVVNSANELETFFNAPIASVKGGATESVIYLPLVVEERVIGCITAQSFRKNAFDENDLEMLKTIANYTAVALDNAESHAQLEATLANLETTQEQLVNQEKMAGLGTMTAGLMHEINNPTNFTHASIFNLKGKLKEHFEFLKELAGGEEAPHDVLELFAQKKRELNEIIDTAQEGTTRIKKIISDLSSFSRNDTGEKQSASIAKLVDSAIGLVKTEYKNILFKTDDVEEVSLLCFQSKLSQVLINLLVNACHAINSKKETGESFVGKIIIEAHRNGDEVVLILQDNGCGMNEETQKKIFEPFYTTKDVGKGTGLGMAISYSIIEEHGGSISVSSEQGVGTTFRIYLPFQEEVFWMEG